LCVTDTVKFVDEVFARYAPKPLLSKTTPRNSVVTTVDKQVRGSFPIQSYESATFESSKSSEKFNTGRKRLYNDANSHEQDIHYGNGASTRSSRSKRAPKDVRTSGRRVSSQQLPSPALITSYPFMNAPHPPTPPPGFPAFDPSNPMAAFAIMQTMFPQMVGMLPPSPNGESGTFGNKMRCQDYDSKGYCTLGSSCPYEHGNDPIVAAGDDEYDPTKANFSMNGTQSNTIRASGRIPRIKKSPGGLLHSNTKRDNRAAFSDPRPPSDTTSTTIVVEQIPEDYFDDETVRNFFSQYGKVLDVSMKPYKRLAIVKYDTHAAATRAWESPKAVFENRFVKVFWYRPELEGVISTHGKSSPPKNSDANMNMDVVDEEAFKQQQEEKQKAHEERIRTRKAMEDVKQDLIRRRGIMAKEREGLVKKLALAEGQRSGQSESNGTNSLEYRVATDSPDPKIKALRDQLAKMQAEARSLGIDPDDLPTSFDKQPRGSGRPVRGGFAARAAYGGFGSPRGGGSYRGYGFVRGRDPSVKKLDNRPRNIAISGVDFDSVKEENLRSYLTLIGPFEDIELDPYQPESRIVVFKERWQAEQVMHGRRDIPGVGQVELSWAGRKAGGSAMQATSRYEDVVLGDAGEDGRRTFSDEAAQQQHQQPQEDDLDVAGGDGDDWGNIT
jgi:RNA recognition motif-containing protein